MVIEFQIIAMSYIRKGETPGICRSSFFDFPPRFSYAKSFFSLPFVVLVAEDESVFFRFSFNSFFVFMFWLVAVDVFPPSAWLCGCIGVCSLRFFLFFHPCSAVIVVYILFLARFEYFAVHVLSCNNLIVGFGSLKASQPPPIFVRGVAGVGGGLFVCLFVCLFACPSSVRLTLCALFMFGFGLLMLFGLLCFVFF